jgi:ABC-type phosphate transport system auxiliary subunit
MAFAMLEGFSTMAEVSPAPADGNMSPRVANGDLDFEQQYDRLTASATQLWGRYEQICRDQARQIELQQQLDSKQLGAKTIVPQDLSQDLKSLQTELDNLDVALESQLISWDSFRELFWQAVRFGGLGVAIGWGLKSWAG